MSFETDTSDLRDDIDTWSQQIKGWVDLYAKMVDHAADQTTTADQLVKDWSSLTLGAQQAGARVVSAWIGFGQALLNQNVTPPT